MVRKHVSVLSPRPSIVVLTSLRLNNVLVQRLRERGYALSPHALVVADTCSCQETGGSLDEKEYWEVVKVEARVFMER